MWWFIYLIVPALADAPPSVKQLPRSPAFHTEEQCTAWLVREVRARRLELANDVLATCMSPPEPA
jgi:hypothetical protein